MSNMRSERNMSEASMSEKKTSEKKPYAWIPVDLWNNRLRRLQPLTGVLYFRLATGHEEVTPEGLIPVCKEALAQSLNCQMEDLDPAFEELCSRGLARFESEGRFVRLMDIKFEDPNL